MLAFCKSVPPLTNGIIIYQARLKLKTKKQNKYSSKESMNVLVYHLKKIQVTGKGRANW